VRRWSRDNELGVEFIRLEPEQQARLLSVIQRWKEGSVPINSEQQSYLNPCSRREG
jgi:hypothetical protein